MSPRRTIPTLAALAVAVCLACQATPGAAGDKDKKLPDDVLAVLTKADTLEVLAVDPADLKDSDKDVKAEGRIHKWKILGKTVVKDADKRKAVVDGVVKSVAEGTMSAKCFEPRHAVRASHDGKTVELVICFACNNYHIYKDGKDGGGGTFGAAAQPVLTKILTDAGIPIAK